MAYRSQQGRRPGEVASVVAGAFIERQAREGHPGKRKSRRPATRLVSFARAPKPRRSLAKVCCCCCCCCCAFAIQQIAMFGAALRQNSRVCSRALRLSRGYGRIASGIPSELDSTARRRTPPRSTLGLAWSGGGRGPSLTSVPWAPGSSRQLFGFSTQSAAEERERKGEEETETSTAADQGAEENEAEAEEEAEAEGVSARPTQTWLPSARRWRPPWRRWAAERRLQGQAHRTLADMENLRERTSRQVENSQKFAVQGFVKDLLDVSDNLERALQAVESDYLEQGGDGDLGGEGGEKAFGLLKSLHEGIAMTEKQMVSVLRKNGVERFDPTGEPFDPNLHEARFEVPVPDKAPGTVVVVTKVGYTLHDRVIRPAEVGVVPGEAS